MNRRLNQAVTRGLQYLEWVQLKNGGFESSSSSILQPFQADLTYQTTFVASQIASALTAVDEPAAQKIREKAARFLLRQKSPAWTFNYWAKTSPERKTHPYPDDLDDTFCALTALVQTKTGNQAALLAAAVKILVAAESKPGGPYRTWLVPADSDKVWLDMDVAVNANINYFLCVASEPLPTLNTFIDKAISKGRLKSPYYPSAAPLIYFISRNYAGSQGEALRQLAQSALGKAHTTLERALLLSAMIHLNTPDDLTQELPKLLEAQEPSGAWPAAAFCIDPARDGKTFYHGSEALTTAFVLEVLALYDKHASSQQTRLPTEDKSFERTILQLAAQGIGHLRTDLKKDILVFLRRIAAGSNGQEIMGLASAFNKSLIKPVKDDELFVRLGLANLYGWAAYTIYDDFLDEEGVPAQLPIANVAHRRSLALFQAATQEPFVAKTFDTIDSANAWEIKNCRFHVGDGVIKVSMLPDYGNRHKLAERSLGHALGPLVLMSRQGYDADSMQHKQLLNALKHYLIARQLNDDAHDWQEDVSQGHITYVVAALLKDCKITPGEYSLPTLTAQLRQQFWHKTLPEICRTMQQHVRLSRQALKASHIMRTQNFLTGLLDNLEVSVDKTLKTHAQAAEFLTHYKRSSKDFSHKQQ